jgi:AAA family ATP:ADP antiporter
MDAPAPRRGLLDRALAPFADVRAGEGAGALVMALNVFLVLTAYYLIKTAREPLILAGGGAEVKSFAAAGQTLLLLGLVPAYAAFASRVKRAWLISGVMLFFVSNLVVFWLLARAATPGLGVAFFLWVGIFNMMVVAQFWSFANETYTPEQGKRLFAVVAFGQTLGAVGGAWLAGRLIGVLGVRALLLVAAAMLLGSIGLTLWSRRIARREPEAPPGVIRAAPAERPLARVGAFRLVLSSRYLLAIGLLMTAVNFVNTNGEYLLGRAVTDEATRLYPGVAAEARRGAFIGGFYADFFLWVNVLTALLQAFVVSRVLKWFGVRAALFVMPVLAFGGYALLAAAPVLALVRGAKVLENATDYSIQNTTRQALFLPTSPEAKYSAKQAIDSLFVRAGDLLSTGVVFLGTAFALQTRHFAMVNLVLVALWLVAALAVALEHRRVSDAAEAVAARPGG